MSAYVWYGLEEVRYFSKTEIIISDDGKEVTKEIIYPVTASKNKNNLTKETKKFEDAINTLYYYRDRKGNKYVFDNMAEAQKQQDYCFSINYDERLMVNMNFEGKPKKVILILILKDGIETQKSILKRYWQLINLFTKNQMTQK